jgi:hypothetical protein
LIGEEISSQGKIKSRRRHFSVSFLLPQIFKDQKLDVILYQKRENAGLDLKVLSSL